jgi:hypothetical protein
MQIPHDGEHMELYYVFQFLFQCDNTTQLGMSFLQCNIFNVLEFVLINNKKLFLFDKSLFRIKNQNGFGSFKGYSSCCTLGVLLRLLYFINYE